jgi:hypothetical protein
VVLDCGRPSAPAISPTVAARFCSRKYSRIAKVRSADFTAVPAAAFDLLAMLQTHHIISAMMLVCGSEVHGRATELLRTRGGEHAAQNMNSPPFTWMTWPATYLPLSPVR